MTEALKFYGKKTIPQLIFWVRSVNFMNLFQSKYSL